MKDPKQKAKQLIDKFSGIVSSENELEKHLNKCACATIVADEILKATPMYTGNLNTDWEYWCDVKKHIEELSNQI